MCLKGPCASNDSIEVSDRQLQPRCRIRLSYLKVEGRPNFSKVPFAKKSSAFLSWELSQPSI